MILRVLDSYALLSFFQDGAGAEQVEKLLAKAELGGPKLLLSVVHWGEVYYTTMRRLSQRAAEEKAREIATLPIELVAIDTDLALARQAAIFKASRRLAYADAFAAALAKLRDAELVTGDTDFEQVDGEIKILWLK
jgi:predicted nucleic acid-binding protein